LQAEPARSAPYAELAKALSSKALQQVADFAVGDVVQLVRTLLSRRHNDVSDLEISNLVQPTSVRPVTVSAISLHFRKLVVRFSFLTSSSCEIEVRHVWRTVFRQELIAELFDEES
jgi:hypothetical protein